MDQWTSSDSGILRKTGLKQTHEDLLVFGYACKLFRGDEKALFIDQGKHLIPWLGNENLKIDRYDCRGALSDLSKYEAGKEGYDTMRWLGLSDKERHLEELCDKERYYSLEINEEEEEMYKDEEEKRQKMNAIPFSYDVPQNPEANTEGIPTVEAKEVDEVYVPPPILDVPVDIDIPTTVKENARIEKTALFVCRQGPQMEILIKAKQGDNPQFSFLNQNDRLYKFYRHVLLAFKNGRYMGYESLNESNKEIEETQEQEPTNLHLHSSLSANSTDANAMVEVPQVTYKPSEKCAYSQLVNRIQGAQDGVSDQPKATMDESFARLTYEQQQQYYQYFYIQQYYEYYKQLALYQQGEGVDPGHFIPPADFHSLDPNIQNYIQQIAYNQYIQQHQLHQQQQMSNNSYAQIVSNVNRDLNPYTANVPQLPNILQKFVNSDKGSVADQERVILEENSNSKIIMNQPLLSLAAAYGSDSESDSEGSVDEENKVQSEEDKNTDKEEKKVYKVPIGETQIVIDKMAAYVCKNGEQFEEIVKTKGDPRFDFLYSHHEFNKYYREKIKELREENKQLEIKETNKETKQVRKEKKIIAPVSFSIKKPKEEQPKEIKSALPVEESDEEDVEAASQIPQSVTVTPPSLVAVLMRYTENQTANKKQKEVDDSIEEDNNCSETKEEENDNFNKKIGILDCDDPLLEMIELSGNDVKKESKRAEDKIKDKLAAAAREKLASISRDRALQQERKKKAAAFLKLKSEESSHNSGYEKLPISPVDKDPVEIALGITSKSDNDRLKDKDSRSRDIKERLGHKSSDCQKNKLDFEGKKVELIKLRSRSKSRERERRYVDYEVEHSKRKKDKDRKKSHKRKHSKHKSSRKAKKRQKKSESEDSNDSDSP